MSDRLTLLLGKRLRAEEVTEFLTDLEIAPEVGEGENGLLYYTFKTIGLELAFDEDDRLASVFFFAGVKDDRGHHEGYARYKGRLPKGVSFSMSRSKVIGMLGPPAHSGGGEAEEGLGACPAWDTYVGRKARLHIQYLNGGESISLIELALPPAKD